MKEKWKIDFWVDAYALAFDAQFSMIHIVEDTGAPEDVVIDRLLSLVADGKILIRWTVFCPECANRTIVASQDENPVCIFCEDGEDTPRVVLREFIINPKYRQFVMDFTQFEEMEQFLV